MSRSRIGSFRTTKGIRAIVLALTPLALAPTLQACAGCGTPDVSVTPNPTVGPTADHEVRCACQIGWDDLSCALAGTNGIPDNLCNPNPRSFDIDMCVPANLNTALGATPTDAEFTAGINDFCSTTVVSSLTAFLGAISGNNGCGHFTISCAPGTLSSGLAVQVNPRCDKPCADIACVTSGAGANCDLNSVFSGPTGIDPTQCNCTNTSGCSTSTANVCQPMNSVADPPSLTQGFLAGALGQASTVVLDSAASTMAVTVTVDGPLGTTFSDTQTTHLHGNVALYGRPCPGSACQTRIGLNAYADDMTFRFGCVGDVCFASSTLSSMAIVGGTGDVAVNVDATGHGTIPVGALSIIADGTQDGSRMTVSAPNIQAVDFQVDFAGKTFSIPGGANATFSNGSSATIQLAGAIANQPPRAVAGADRVLECTSPQGAQVTLDAAGTSDPDGDQIAYNWWSGAPFTSAGLVFDSQFTATVVAPFTPPSRTTQYWFTVSDSHLDTDGASTRVTVQDTTPPALTLSADPGCLWPPNHKMVLYELGNGLDAVAADACDASPRVEIVSVVSNQPALGGGSGNTPVDVIQGTRAFCVRAERDGTVKGDRVYTVTVRATDASDNSRTQTIDIVVGHDQARAKCANVARSREVADGDPRCSADVVVERSRLPVSEPPVVSRAAGSGSARGCGAAGASAGVATLVALLPALALMRRRRR
ncbi:MAG TPA: hypothetical protein VIV57_20630 [Anaeromyxobacter sp.]